MFATPNLRPPSLNASVQSHKSQIAELRHMDCNAKVRVFVTMPIALRQKINANIKANPDNENERIVKCVRIGYEQLTKKPV
jgi:hypothetical protein